MWIDLILIPEATKRGGNTILWMDNCGCHVTDQILQRMKDAGIFVARYPPNMTAILQVLDLVVNGPLKRHIRKWTANVIVEAFLEYRERFRARDPKLGKFRPTKPKANEAVDKLFELIATGEFSTQKFKDSIARSFVASGMTPIPGQGLNFVQYKESKRTGTIKCDPAAVLSDVVVDIDVPVVVEEKDKEKDVEAVVIDLMLGEDTDEEDDSYW